MDPITIGCKTYTKAQALTIVNALSSSDMTYALAAQLGAAKLNVSCCKASSTCVASAISSADKFLCTYPVGCKLSASSTSWKNFLTTYNTLVSYNQGKLCAPACN
jgi:hypothetical protein